MAQLHFYYTQSTKRCMSWLSTGRKEADCKKKNSCLVKTWLKLVMICSPFDSIINTFLLEVLQVLKQKSENT